MRLAGLRCLATVVALALLGVAAPTSGLAQGSATTDAASDQADQTPSAELRIDEAFGRAWLGASDADVTLVVFADYACPACRTAQPVIDQLLAQDHKLKVVYRLLDNDQGGRTAALTSLAVARQGADWGKFHRALDTASDLTPKTIADAIAASGVDPAKLPHIEDADDPETAALADELSHNDAFINQRNGTAIPAWLIGDDPAQKGFDLPRLQAAIAKARAASKH
jgi:protein-disulfide isomerase